MGCCSQGLEEPTAAVRVAWRNCTCLALWFSGPWGLWAKRIKTYFHWLFKEQEEKEEGCFAKTEVVFHKPGSLPHRVLDLKVLDSVIKGIPTVKLFDTKIVKIVLTHY